MACARALAHTARTLTHTLARASARIASWPARLLQQERWGREVPAERELL